MANVDPCAARAVKSDHPRNPPRRIPSNVPKVTTMNDSRRSIVRTWRRVSPIAGGLPQPPFGRHSALGMHTPSEHEILDQTRQIRGVRPMRDESTELGGPPMSTRSRQAQPLRGRRRLEPFTSLRGGVEAETKGGVILFRCIRARVLLRLGFPVAPLDLLELPRAETAPSATGRVRKGDLRSRCAARVARYRDWKPSYFGGTQRSRLRKKVPEPRHPPR